MVVPGAWEIAPLFMATPKESVKVKLENVWVSFSNWALLFSMRECLFSIPTEAAGEAERIFLH